jgi:hypothetical protein
MRPFPPFTSKSCLLNGIKKKSESNIEFVRFAYFILSLYTTNGMQLATHAAKVLRKGLLIQPSIDYHEPLASTPRKYK